MGHHIDLNDLITMVVFRTRDALSAWSGLVLWACHSGECLCSANRTLDGRLVGVVSPHYPVPAAARFCSNSQVRQSVLPRGAPLRYFTRVV